MKKITKNLMMMILLGSFVVTTCANPITTMAQQQPYKDISYDLDIVSEKDWENTDIGKYPIDVNSTVWSQLSSIETAAACDMPKKYAESLSTEELVDYAINYPFLMDVFAFDNIADGMNHLADKSYVFKELFSRPDCYDKLIDEYLGMDIDYTEVAVTNDVCKTSYDSELFIEEYLGLNYNSLSEDQAEKFVKEYGNKYLDMNDECRESVFSTIIYDAIYETLGEVPEDAIPDIVAEKLVNSTDKSGASFTAISTTFCTICFATQTYGTITVHGNTVYCYNWVFGGYTPDDIIIADKYIADLYPSFTKISSASSKYNCHSYAWYSTSTTNTYWIDDPSPIYSNTSYWTFWQVPMRTITSGDRITFWNNSSLQHSAVIYSSTQCTSKLGHYGVYRTTISEMISLYGATATKAYLPT